MATPLMEEKTFTCPCCGASISMLLELAHGGQEYIEDCEICCSPIVVSYRVEAGGLSGFTARPSQG